MYLARELTDHSLPEIGRGVGGRNHATVIHAINRVGAACAPIRPCAQPSTTCARSSTAPLDGRPYCDNQHLLPLPSTGATPRARGIGPVFHLCTGPTTPVSVRKILKLTVSRETFLARFGVAVRAASTRSAIQTLAGVLIRVEEGCAELQATDMELGLRVSLEPESSTPGQAVIPGRLLLDVVRSLPKDDLTLEYRSAQQDVEVTSGQARFHLRTLPPEDFPKLPEAPTDRRAHRADAGLRRHDRPRGPRGLAGRDAPASHRRARHGQRQRAAHGRHRLLPAGREGDAARARSSTARSRPTCRPGRCRSSAASPAPASAETIGVAALENQVIFTADGVVLSSRLVEGRFPNYQQLLPDSYEHELRVSRDELLEVVRRVGLLAQKNAPLRLRFTEGALDVSAQTPDVGEASESLPVPFAGEELEIGFNPEFFREGLESAESDELILKLISPLRPGPHPVGRRRRRLPLPRDADPPERLGRRVRVTRVELRDFRNYDRPRSTSATGLTVICGPERRRQDEPPRGASTSAAPAARRGPRNERELVRRGAAVARVDARARGRRRRAHRSRSASSRASPSASRRRQRRSTASPGLDARPPVSVFLPERLELVKGAPAARRAHLDQLVAALWPARAGTRAAYSRALAQRNALLARVRARARRPEALAAWDARARPPGPRS